MAAEFPTSPYTANQQNEGNDTPGDLTIANAKDYNIHDNEIKAITDNLRAGLIRAFRNNTGGTLTGGTLVHITGFDATSGLPTVTKSQANVFGTLTEYVVIADVLNNANGNISNRYIVATLNTSSFSAGDEVYLDPTTPGTFTITAPSGANFAQYVGKITKVNATTGEIEFNISRPAIPDKVGLEYGATEILQLKAAGVTAAKLANPVADSIPKLAAITNSGEGGGGAGANTVRFVVQVQDIQGNNLSRRCCLFVYMSDDAFGDPTTITSLTAATGVDIPIVNAQSMMVTTDTTGKIEIDAEFTGIGTKHIMVCLETEVATDAATFG